MIFSKLLTLIQFNIQTALNTRFYSY